MLAARILGVDAEIEDSVVPIGRADVSLVARAAHASRFVPNLLTREYPSANLTRFCSAMDPWLRHGSCPSQPWSRQSTRTAGRQVLFPKCDACQPEMETTGFRTTPVAYCPPDRERIPPSHSVCNPIASATVCTCVRDEVGQASPGDIACAEQTAAIRLIRRCPPFSFR